jgi:hypothetical protein
MSMCGEIENVKREITALKQKLLKLNTRLKELKNE